MVNFGLPWALALGFLCFYVYTLQPGLSWGDGARLQVDALTGESQVIAAIFDQQSMQKTALLPFAHLGVAAWDHPLWVVLCHTLLHRFSSMDALRLVNGVTSVFGAGSVVLLYGILLEHTRATIPALLAAIALGLSHTFWFHAVTPEVYTLFAFLLLTSLFLFAAYQKTGKVSMLAGSFLALGLGVSNHLLAALALPAFLFWTLQPRHSSLAWHLFLAGLAFLAGSALYFIQLLRLAYMLPIARLARQVFGVSYLAPLWATISVGALAGSLVRCCMYLVLQFGPLVLVGLYGLINGRREYPELWRTTLVLGGVYMAFCLYYRVDDQFAFILPSCIFWALAIGMGIATLLSRVPETRRRYLPALLAAMLLSMPFVYQILPGLLRAAGASEATFGIPSLGTSSRDGLAYFVNPNKRGDHSAEQFGQRLLAELPDEAVLITPLHSDPDVFFVLNYYLSIEGLRPDISIYSWPLEPPYNFDAGVVTRTIEEQFQNKRPLFIASLNEDYYQISVLKQRYCITPQANLYRLYVDRSDSLTNPGIDCLK